MSEEQRDKRKTLFWGIAAIAMMWAGVVAVCWPPAILPGMEQAAADYRDLHERRMEFARQSILTAPDSLPAWYSREALGTPFWSNVQNFPFIPNRLLILFSMDPQAPYTFATAVTLAALLTSLFTYFYCRRIGFIPPAAAASGWTFACCGYFIARITVGHLPLLEAFWGLPLLLWIVESLTQRRNQARPIGLWLYALAASCMCLALAGHPQLPFYALVCGAVYVVVRSGVHKSLRLLFVMALGFGCAAFAVLPATMLIARSTRTLSLSAANNDLALPYARLLGFFFPWADGVPPPLKEAAANMFHGYPRGDYFWDTFCYIGWMPWLAMVLILFWNNPGATKLPVSVRRFLIAIGILGIVLALPFVQAITSQMPGTMLRSPARLLYLTEFALAIVMGAAIDRIARNASKLLIWTVLPAVLIVHVIDLAKHNRRFIMIVPSFSESETNRLATLLQTVGNDRAAIDYSATTRVNRTVDDVGFFDSIILARPYLWLMDSTGAPAGFNSQLLNGSDISEPALAAADVKLLVTYLNRRDLVLQERVGKLNIFKINSSTERAQFFDLDHVRYASRDEIHRQLRNQPFSLPTTLFLPLEARSSRIENNSPDESATVEYRRPSSDEIQCSVATPKAGFVRIIESWDPGWSATLDNQPISTYPAMDALLAIEVPAGRHSIRLNYHTPGAYAGLGISGVCTFTLIVFIWFSRKPGV
jgi:hypothetical protein